MFNKAIDLKKPNRYLSPWAPHEKLEENSPEKQVVTCFIQSGKHILVLQRARKDQQHGLWGIPGGKLDTGETPISGLVREIFEETNIELKSSNINLLGTALSQTFADGKYGLYLYHTVLEKNIDVKINPAEHHEFRWVTLDTFISLPLLFAQGEAFAWVEAKLRKFI